jgi:fused signal recognition particle receptor
MFESLKKKFSSWLKIEPDKKEKSKKKSKIKKEKPKKSKEKIKKSPRKEKIFEKVEEEVTQEKKPVEIFSFFSKIKEKLSSSKLTKQEFQEIFEDLEIILLENNVALEVVDKIKEKLQNQLVEKEIEKSKISQIVLDALKNSIKEVLIEPPDLIKEIKESNEPYVILFFGINGSGKTTSVAKLSNFLKKNKISSVLAAADTFRAASIEQLEIHANKLNVPIIKHEYGSDPSAVAFDAISYAKKNKIKVVLIDTAGRMYTKKDLMNEMEKIVRVSKPNLKIFVGESITGNDATEQARMFNEAVTIDGTILTKADIDEKAGTILSVSYITNKPIYFLGTGQEYSDLTPFSKTLVLKHLGLD